MNIYVGNLAHETTQEQLKAAFEAFGQVSSASIITDKMTGQSRGFGFVEMPSDEEAKAAIEGLNDKELDGRTLKVSQSTGGGKKTGGSGGFGGRRGGGFGGGRGGFGGNRGGSGGGRGGREGRSGGGYGGGGRSRY